MFVEINGNYYNPSNIVSIEKKIVDYGTAHTPPKYEICVALNNNTIMSTAMGTNEEMTARLEEILTACNNAGS